MKKPNPMAGLENGEPAAVSSQHFIVSPLQTSFFVAQTTLIFTSKVFGQKNDTIRKRNSIKNRR